VGKKEFYINSSFSPCIVFAQLSPNVKVVYDVFGVAIKELRSSFSNPKNVAEKKPTKGEARLGFFGARAALAAKRIQSCYTKWWRTLSFSYYSYKSLIL
jgi:hypothetical protein